MVVKSRASSEHRQAARRELDVGRERIEENSPQAVAAYGGAGEGRRSCAALDKPSTTCRALRASSRESRGLDLGEC